MLGEHNAANVPFSVGSFTSQLIQNQQAKTLSDVLVNDAAVQTELGFGNFAQLFKIRGFELDGEDISFGGLYGVLPRQIVQTNFANRVDLFKGATAFATGVAPAGTGVGDAVNIEPKFAADTPITQFRLGYQSDSRIEEALDLSRRYGDRKQHGARLSVQHVKGDTAINGENAADTSVGLDYNGGRARAGFYFGYQKQHIKHGRSVVYTGSATEIPDAPDADTNYAASFNSSELENEFGLLRGEFDLTRHWTTYAAIGANHADEQGEYGSPTLVGNDGDASIYRLGVPFEAHSFSGQAGVRGNFDTGPVSHQINFGYSGYYRRTDSAYKMSDYANQAPTNIYDPADIGYLPTASEAGNQDDANVRTRTRADGWALSDTAGLFDDKVLVTVGGRYQVIAVDNYSYQGESDGHPIRGHKLSPVYGVVYKPIDWLSLYANHIQALQPGDAASATAVNSGQVIGIAESKQNEVGAKADFGRIGGAASRSTRSRSPMPRPTPTVSTATTASSVIAVVSS